MKTHLDTLYRPPPRHRPAALGRKPPQSSGQGRGDDPRITAERSLYRDLEQLDARAGQGGLAGAAARAAQGTGARVLLGVHPHGDTELLDLPLGTVKGRMKLGLKKIREHFGSRGMEVP